METGNLIHLGAELVVQMLMLYSTSPHARRLTSQMLTDDPFAIDVKLDIDSVNRNAEILNVYLKTMGLKLSFKRIPKNIIHPMTIYPMSFKAPLNECINPMTPINRDEKFDSHAHGERLYRMSKQIRPLVIYPMKFYDKKNSVDSEEE